MFTQLIALILRGVCESNHATHSKLLRCCVSIPSLQQAGRKKRRNHMYRTKSHRCGPLRVSLQPSCFLFLSQTPLEDHRCLGQRPELNLLTPRSCSLQGRHQAAEAHCASFLPHLPQLLSPPARPATGLLQSSNSSDARFLGLESAPPSEEASPPPSRCSSSRNCC